ncbi:MAG: aminotransferase class V-fold PLP-dependent enzyme [Acidobacteria bacterium]|jgi:selenocysteine lyase/cysteine desulfurase|nr:aminotransferase class V-fold PLP-dependent enzyme [Acidobacteriota bacterium]
MNKRSFLRTSASAGLGLLFGDEVWAELARLPASRLAESEEFWGTVRARYRLKPDYVNLENGYYCIQSQPVLEAFIARVREQNYQGSYYLRTSQVPDKAAACEKLAAMAGCEPGELIITRNTTESLDTVISGFDWEPGDEAVMAVHDYPHMLAQFRLMARRHGMVNKLVTVPLDPKSDEEVVEVYAEAITPRTRLLMVCHMINITGHILPVRKIADMAHARGVQVMVDGAHTFAHLDFRIPDLGCDYFGTSLHKWLGVPLGAGLLYVRKDRIPALWPIYGDGSNPADDDVMKLNHTGTHPVHTDLAIADAIDFHNMLGAERKEARLRYLTEYWTSRVRGMENVVLNSPSDPARLCGIANAGVRGVPPSQMAKTLLDRYGIWTVAIDNNGVQGCRITPHVFVLPRELDALVTAISEMSATA